MGVSTRSGGGGGGGGTRHQARGLDPGRGNSLINHGWEPLQAHVWLRGALLGTLVEETEDGSSSWKQQQQLVAAAAAAGGADAAGSPTLTAAGAERMILLQKEPMKDRNGGKRVYNKTFMLLFICGRNAGDNSAPCWRRRALLPSVLEN